MFLPLRAWHFWRRLYDAMDEHNVFNGAAAVAYYLTLSIFPAFIVVFTLIPYLPVQNVDREIMAILYDVLPMEVAQLLEGTVAEVTLQGRGGLLSFGVLFTLWTISTGMYATMQQLNVTYEIEERRGFIAARVTAILLSLVFVALVIGAMILIALGDVVEIWVLTRISGGEVVPLAFRLLRWGVVVFALLLSFALVYRFAPNVKRRFRILTPGSILGVFLLIVASVGFTQYIRNFGNYAATYGSLGAVIVLMLWLYIVGLVVLLGSEVNILSARMKRERRV